MMEAYFQRRKDFYTHVVLDGQRGCWYLPLENKAAFHADYCLRQRQWCLAEKPGTTVPILVDVDLKRAIGGGAADDEPLYTRDQVLTFVEHCRGVLKKMVRNADATCVLLEKKARVEKGFHKHGFHLHFPKCFLTTRDFGAVHRALNTFPDWDLDDPTGKFWLVYGSSKTLESEAYMVTEIFSDHGETDCLEYDDRGHDFEMMPSIDDFSSLVEWLSINNHGRPTRQLTAEAAAAALSARSSSSSIPLTEFCDDNDDDDANNSGGEDQTRLLEALLGVIKKDRADDYHTWMEIGIIIYNETRGKGLPIFLRFSESSTSKYDEVGCLTFWRNLKLQKRRKTLGTLIFLARKDDAKETERVLDEWKAERVSTVPTTEYRIAADFYEWNPDNFMYCSQNKWWYIFDKHYWRKINDEQLYFTPMMVRMSDWYKNRLSSYDDINDKKAVGSLIRKLETSSSQNNIIRQLCSFYFYSEDLPQLMNMNANLVAFKNGVYDTERHVFREGMPRDLISKSLAIDYVSEPSQRDLNDLHQYFEMILPDPEVREYFFRCLCGVFTGGNPEKICLFWTGKGNNGKSKTQLLFEKMFGVLACKLPISVLTSKRGKVGTATPELAMLAGGVRWAVVEEPEETDAIQSGIFKNLTGNDSIYARPVYGQPIEFTPMCKLMVICNELPMIVGGDKATWLRVRVIPFESRFSASAPEDRAEQMRLKHFPIDVNVERRFPVMARTLAHYLLRLYKIKMEDEERGVVYRIPDKVNKASLEYQISSNKILATCQELFVRVSQPRVTMEELFGIVNKHWKIYYSHETLSLQTFANHYADINEKGVYYAFKDGSAANVVEEIIRE
jgi:P4 family phage/plasmid primase-like protien